MFATSPSSPLLCLGWTLIHAVWQAGFVWIIYRIARSLMRNPAHRCHLGHVALAVFLAMQCLTFVYLLTSTGPITSTISDSTFERIAADIKASRQLPVPQLGATELAVDWIAEHEQFLPILVLLWALGLLWQVLRTGADYLRLQRHLGACPELDEAARASFAQLAQRVGLRREVTFIQSDAIDSPATARWLKPIVLVPLSAMTDMDPRDLEALILHELAHIKRWDYATHIFRTLALSLYFFLPFVRDICNRIADDAEQATDRLASNAVGEAKRYANALVALAEFRRLLASQPPIALPISAGGGDLRGRILDLLGSPTLPILTLRSRMSLAGTIMAGAVAVVLLLDATAWSSQTRATMHRLRTNSLATIIVESLTQNAPDDAFIEPMANSIEELHFIRSVSPATRAKFVDALLHRVDANVLYRRIVAVPGRVNFDMLRNYTFGPFGHNGDRIDLIEDLQTQATLEPDAVQQSRVARATLVYASITAPADSGRAATMLLRDEAFIARLHLSEPEYRLLRLAVAINDDRQHQLGNVIAASRRPAGCSDADVEAFAEELPYLPAFQLTLCNLPVPFQTRVMKVVRRDLQTYPPGSVDLVLAHSAAATTQQTK